MLQHKNLKNNIDKKAIEISLKWLGVLGLNPYINNTESKFRALGSVIYQLLSCVSYCMQIGLGDDWDRAIQNLASLCGAYQGIVKAIGLRILHKRIVELVQASEKFWPLNRYGDTAADFFEEFHRKLFILIKVYWFIIGFGIGLYLVKPLLLKPFIDKGRELPVQWYDVTSLNNTWYYVPAYTYQVGAGAIMWLNVAGFDRFFFSMLAMAYCEVEKIKYGLLNHTKDNYKELASIIHQHNAVLRFVGMINDTFSLLFLNQIVTSFGMVCMTIYLLSESGYDINMLTQWIPYGVLVSGQIFVYCLVGNILADQMESIADVAYDIDWYNWKEVKLRKSLILIMARARKRDQIRFGGILTLNLNLFVSVVKKAFSMYTFLQTVKAVE